MGAGDVLLPGQLKVHYAYHDTGMAEGHAMPVQGIGGSVGLQVFGGLTKLEAMATQLAAGIVSNMRLDLDPQMQTPVVMRQAVKSSVDLAQAILIECGQRQRGVPPEAESTG